MKTKLLLAVAVIAISTLAESAAQAAVGTATFTGTVTSLTDSAGLFSGAKVGDAFTSVWTLDTELGNHAVNPGNVQYAYGGSQYEPGHSSYDPSMFGPSSYNSPVLSANLTINGITVGFLGDTYGNGQTYFGSVAFVANSDHNPPPFTDKYYTQLLNFFDNAPRDLLTSFNVSEPSGAYGSYDIARPGVDSHGVFSTTKMTWQVAGVPEPATWALMIGGFGLTGAGLRRQRRVVAAD